MLRLSTIKGVGCKSATLWTACDFDMGKERTEIEETEDTCPSSVHTN